MNEIEKMYKNAGLSNVWVERYNDGYYEHERYYNSYKEMINNMMKANDWTLTEAQEVAKRECKKEHPPFTAKKQIELIKFLAGFLIHIKNIGGQINISIGDSYVSYYAENLSDAIALCINSKWKNLTSEEQKQIKEILNG